jgi:hypothetical protein
MADEVTSNLPQVQRELANWTAQVGPVIEDHAHAFGEALRAQIAGRVPYLTGTLSRSVVEQPAPVGVAVGMGEGVPYAQWIEFGGTRGRPYVSEGRYVYPTALDAVDEFAKMAEDAITASINAYPWSKPT